MNSTTYRWLLESHIEQTRAHLQRLETELEKYDAAEARDAEPNIDDPAPLRFEDARTETEGRADLGIVEDRDRWRRVAEAYRERLTALAELFEDIGENRVPSYIEGYEAAEHLLDVLAAGTVAEGATIAAPQSPYRAGDPDPTLGAEPAPVCNASIPNDSGWYWYCTWQPGHTGDHVAGNGESVCAVWPQTPPVPVEDLRAPYSRGLSYPDPKESWQS